MPAITIKNKESLHSKRYEVTGKALRPDVGLRVTTLCDLRGN